MSDTLRLLGRSVGSLDHVFAGKDVDLHTAVLLLAVGGGVGSHRILFSVAFGVGDACCGVAGGYNLLLDSIGAVLRESHILCGTLLGRGVLKALEGAELQYPFLYTSAIN